MRATVSTRARGRAEDPEDLAAVARGDQKALGRLYDRYGRVVFSLALRVVEDRGAAEEVTQDVFLKLWRQAGALEPSRGDLISWLVTITRNRGIDWLRSRYQRASSAWVPLDSSRLPASSSVVFGVESVEQIRRALAQLPERQREVIELAYYQGLSQTEIAARLSQPLGTVKTWTRNAFKVLREALKS